MTGRLESVGPDTPPDEVRRIVEQWVQDHVPERWRTAALEGRAALREARSTEDYEAWYPVYAESGLVVPTWAHAYGGLDVGPEAAATIAAVLSPYRLTRLNPLGLNNAAAALFAHGTEQQRQRFLPPMVRNDERWCQLFSEPGAGSDLASLACRAVPDGDEWRVTGQKVWTTWATDSDFAILLARTNPTAPKHRGITYFLLDLHQPGVEIRPLRQITGEAEFNEVWLDEARVPDAHRVGAVDDGWRVSASTLSSERAMVSGGSGGGLGGLGGLGGVRAERVVAVARAEGAADDPVVRQALARAWTEERIREWTARRHSASRRADLGGGAVASVGKVHQAALNQSAQTTVTALLGPHAIAWEQPRVAPDREGPDRYAASLRPEVRAMLRSRANSIEGGTSEVNKNILAERALGLPREPDPWRGVAWEDVPRS